MSTGPSPRPHKYSSSSSLRRRKSNIVTPQSEKSDVSVPILRCLTANRMRFNIRQTPLQVTERRSLWQSIDQNFVYFSIQLIF